MHLAERNTHNYTILFFFRHLYDQLSKSLKLTLNVRRHCCCWLQMIIISPPKLFRLMMKIQSGGHKTSNITGLFPIPLITRTYSTQTLQKYTHTVINSFHRQTHVKLLYNCRDIDNLNHLDCIYSNLILTLHTTFRLHTHKNSRQNGRKLMTNELLTYEANT